MRIRKKISHNILGVGSSRALILLWNFFLILKVSPDAYGEFSYTYSTVIALSSFAYLGFNIAVPKNGKDGITKATLGFLLLHVFVITFLILGLIVLLTSVNITVAVVLLSLGFTLTNTVIIIVNTTKDQHLLPIFSFCFFLGFILALILLPREYLLVPAIAYGLFGLAGIILMIIRRTVAFSWHGLVGYKLILKDSLVIGIGTVLNGLVIAVANEYMLGYGGARGFAVIGELRQIQSLFLILPTLIFPVLISENKGLTLGILRFLRKVSLFLVIAIVCLSLSDLPEHIYNYASMSLSVFLSVFGLLLSPLLLDSGTDKFMVSNVLWSFTFGLIIVLFEGSVNGFIYATFCAYLFQLIYFLIYIWSALSSARRLDIVVFLIITIGGLRLLMC